MESKKILINSFNIDNSYFVLNDKYKNEYFLEIKDGSVNVDIETDEGACVGLKYLEVGDIVKLYGKKLNFNKFIIKKIYIKTKYKFDSDSDDDFNFYY